MDGFCNGISGRISCSFFALKEFEYRRQVVVVGIDFESKLGNKSWKAGARISGISLGTDFTKGVNPKARDKIETRELRRKKKETRFHKE